MLQLRKFDVYVIITTVDPHVVEKKPFDFAKDNNLLRATPEHYYHRRNVQRFKLHRLLPPRGSNYNIRVNNLRYAYQTYRIEFTIIFLV